MRQLLGFVIAAAMVGSGAWLLYMQLFISPVIKGWLIMSAGLLLAAGAVWLIGDFIAPAARRLVERKP